MSPYFPPGSTYWCPNCKAHYYVPRISVSCYVIHSPGECCHVGERQVEVKPK